MHRQGRDYATLRQAVVWHVSKPERYPELIVQAKDEQDMIAAVFLRSSPAGG